MKLLLLDIETAPNLAHVWGLWQQNVAVNQIIDSGYVLCWGAKWLGQDEIFFNSLHSNPKDMLDNVHRLLGECDAVVHYNGASFDIPTLNREFVSNGMRPPAPYKQIDLLKTVKSQFRFPSNKLEYVAKALGIGEKMKHSGHELWIRCMADDATGWEEMKQYNIKDVMLLENLYHRLQPWIKGHPNHGLYDVAGVCPVCGSHNLHHRGRARTGTGIYLRLQCQDCGAWSREATTETTTEQRKALLRNIV
jgi:DNA polymerase elongation subunit (family B)